LRPGESLDYSHPICARYYSDEFFDADIPMYLQRARINGSPILELGCGTGRILIPLAQAGFHIAGIELYPSMLKATGEKIAELDEPVRKRIKLIQADMSAFCLKQRFKMAYISANTMFHLPSQKQQQCLECVYYALKPGGEILIDCESHTSMITAQECIGLLSRCDDYDEDGKAVSVRSWITQIDVKRRIMQVRTEVTEKDCSGNISKRTYSYTLHWFDKDEMEQLLDTCGFTVTDIYSDWDMRRFSEGHHRMIFAANRGSHEAGRKEIKAMTKPLEVDDR
jgi:SAM-dependent methyltransferase